MATRSFGPPSPMSSNTTIMTYSQHFELASIVWWNKEPFTIAFPRVCIYTMSGSCMAVSFTFSIGRIVPSRKNCNSLPSLASPVLRVNASAFCIVEPGLYLIIKSNSATPCCQRACRVFNFCFVWKYWRAWWSVWISNC